MRVLLVENDDIVAQNIEILLKKENFNVYTTDIGEEGVDLGKLYDYDIILLELNLPDMSGYDVIRNLRKGKVKTPILVISIMSEAENKVKALGFGADDYLGKPFDNSELIARIHAIVRRSKGHARSVITTGQLVVDLDEKTVEVSEVRIRLTSKEYQTLELLSLRRGTTLTREMLFSHLYGGMDEPELKVIDTFIGKLRKKLKIAPNQAGYIETVHGRGYLLGEPDILPDLPTSPTNEPIAKATDEGALSSNTLRGSKKRIHQTTVGVSVATNYDAIVLTSSSLCLLLDEKLEVLSSERPNSDNAKAEHAAHVARYNTMRSQLIIFMQSSRDYHSDKIKEDCLGSSTRDFVEGVQSWWRTSHNDICSKVFDTGLFLSAVGVCTLAGAGGPLSVAVSGALVGRKPIVDALKLVRKSVGDKVGV